MHPILFDIAGYGVSTFGFFMVAALVLFYYLVAIVSKRFDLSSDIFTSNYIWILLLALVSGRGFYILGQDVEWDWFSFSYFFQFWDHNISWYGFLAVFLMFFLYKVFQKKEPILEWMDVLSVAFFPAFFLFSLGEFFGGYGFGLPTSSITGMVINTDSFHLSGVLIHPLQMYYVIVSGIIFLLIHYFLKFRSESKGNSVYIPRSGYIFSLSMSILLAISLYLENFRDALDELGGYRLTLVVNTILFIFVFGLYIYVRLTSKRRVARFIRR